MKIMAESLTPIHLHKLVCLVRILKILDFHELIYNYVIQKCDFYVHGQTQTVNEQCIRSLVCSFTCNLFPIAQVFIKYFLLKFNICF